MSLTEVNVIFEPIDNLSGEDTEVTDSKEESKQVFVGKVCTPDEMIAPTELVELSETSSLKNFLFQVHDHGHGGLQWQIFPVEYQN